MNRTNTGIQLVMFVTVKQRFTVKKNHSTQLLLLSIEKRAVYRRRKPLHHVQ